MVTENVERKVVTRKVIVGISVQFYKEKKAEYSHEIQTLKLHKNVQLTQMTFVTHRDLDRLPLCYFNVMRETERFRITARVMLHVPPPVTSATLTFKIICSILQSVCCILFLWTFFAYSY
jgi:hypothetical protein